MSNSPLTRQSLNLYHGPKPKAMGDIASHVMLLATAFYLRVSSALAYLIGHRLRHNAWICTHSRYLLRLYGASLFYDLRCYESVSKSSYLLPYCLCFWNVPIGFWVLQLHIESEFLDEYGIVLHSFQICNDFWNEQTGKQFGALNMGFAEALRSISRRLQSFSLDGRFIEML